MSGTSKEVLEAAEYYYNRQIRGWPNPMKWDELSEEQQRYWCALAQERMKRIHDPNV